MSIRAYKIIRIEKEDEPTFNLWRDTFIMGSLTMHEYLDEHGTISSIYIEIESIEDLLNNFDKEWKEYKEMKYVEDEEKTPQRKAEYRETLEQILKDCDVWGVEYYCY